MEKATRGARDGQTILVRAGESLWYEQVRVFSTATCCNTLQHTAVCCNTLQWADYLCSCG